MRSFLNKVKDIRSDLSDWVFHFVKGTDKEAFKILEKIVTEGKLRSFQNPPTICFSEAPLHEWEKQFPIFASYSIPRFAPYGIAVTKNWLFEQGGRHVIYGTPEEKNDLPEKYRYRHVDYRPSNKDFTWQREWRISTNELTLDSESTVILLPDNDNEFNLVHDFDVDIEYEGGGEFSTNISGKRNWRSFSMTQINQQKTHSDNLIAKIVEEQEIGSEII